MASDSRCALKNVGADVAEFLVLEGKPIGEPVVQHGPFVMNSRDQIMQAFADYQVGLRGVGLQGGSAAHAGI